MISLRNLLKSSLYEWKRRRDNHLLLLLLLVSLIVPVTSNASTNQQVEESVRLIKQKEYAQALDLLHELETSLLNPEQISKLLAFAYLGRGYQQLSSNEFPAAREAFIEGRRYDQDDVRFCRVRR